MKNDLPILEQIHEYEAIVSRIQSKGIPIDDQLAALVLIDHLPSSWNAYRCKLKHEKKKMSLDELISDILIEEANRTFIGNSTDNLSSRSDANLVESQRSATKEKRKGNKKDKNSAKQDVEFKRKYRCWNCNKTGHKKHECRLPPKEKDKEVTKAHLTEDVVAVVTEVNTMTDTVEWIIDSGSTRHICNEEKLFKNLEKLKENNVYLGDASPIQATGTGEVTLKLSSGRTLTLTKVLLVPSMRRNLISSALLMNAGVKQTIDAGKLVLTKGGAYLGKAYCNGNLFLLETINEMRKTDLVYLTGDLDSWHSRLGHLNYKSIKRLNHSGLIQNKISNSSQKCEVCVEAKHFRKLFSKVTLRSSNLLDLIHSDLADFRNVMSRGGKRYYVLFIDDCSRYTKVYLLSSKDETFASFLVYKTEVENQLERKIKRLRTDRGGEYECEPMQSLCKREGIIHERSAPYTPQQNGTAERKNRTLKNMMNAMLLSSGLPNSLWGEAVLAACHILNRVPHKGLEVTPYEMWKGNKPNMSFLRPWGCLVKIGLPNFQKPTVGSKTIDAVFVFYAANSAAYRCLTFNTESKKFGHIIESRDVNFFEDIFPFKNDSLKHIEDPNVLNPVSDTRLEKRALECENSEVRRSVRRRTITNFGPEFITNFLVSDVEFTEEFVHTFLIDDNPDTLSKAMESIDAQFWLEAINSEYESILANHTWEIVDLPKGCKVVRCKWI